MIEDTIVSLEEEEEDECKTSQTHAGIREVFRGKVVKDWKGCNFYCTKHEVLNKILVYHAVQCWRKY